MKLKNQKELLLLIAAATAIICAVVLLFFRADLFKNGLTALIHVSTPFIFGAGIAYVLRPVSLFLEKWLTRAFDRKKSGKHKGLFRLIANLLSILLLLFILVVLILSVLPELINSITGLLAQIPAILEQFQTWIHSLDKGGVSHEVVSTIENGLTSFSEWLTGFLKQDLLPTLQSLVPNFTSSFMGILNVLKNFGLGCIISVYILGSWEKHMVQLKLITYALFPKKAADWIRKEVILTDKLFSGFIHGKLLDSLIIGIICFIFCTVTNMPYTMLISIIVGVTNVIPFFGPYIGAIPSAVLVLTVSPGKCVVFVIFIIVLQQVDGNVLGPAIIGDRLGLSGFWILFAILFFGSFWGVMGMLIGAPLFALLYDLVRSIVVTLLKSRGQDKLIDQYNERFPQDKK